MTEKSAFETFSSDDVLRDGKWRGQTMPPEFLLGIKEEAINFQHSQLWKVLKAELQWFAIKSLIEEGKDGEDIRIARIFGNVVQVIDKKLSNIAS